MKLNDEQMLIVDKSIDRLKKYLDKNIEITTYVYKKDDGTEVLKKQVWFDSDAYAKEFGNDVVNTMKSVFIKKARNLLKENGKVRFVVYEQGNKVYCRYNYENLTKGERHVNPMEQYFDVLQQFKKGLSK